MFRCPLHALPLPLQQPQNAVIAVQVASEDGNGETASGDGAAQGGSNGDGGDVVAKMEEGVGGIEGRAGVAGGIADGGEGHSGVQNRQEG